MVVRELGRDWIIEASGTWSELLRRSDAHPVFMSWDWISSSIETLGDRADIRILGLFENDDLVAVIPVLLNRSCTTMWSGRLSFPYVEQTGADYSDIVCARGYEAVVAQAVADWLTQCDDWVSCEFRDVLPTAVIRRVAELMVEGNVVEDLAGSVCPRLALGGGWQGILKARFERKRRYNIERQMRLAEEKEALRLVFHETPEAVGRAFPILARLHNERKAAQGIKSKFSRPDQLAFHANAAKKLARSGAAFIATLESEREIVSAAYCLRDSQSVYYFQTGVSAAGAALGAGSTLLYMLIRWAANQGLTWFDFLKGKEEYKKSWDTDPVAQRMIRVTRTNVRGRMALAMSGARRALKRAAGRMASNEGPGS